MRTNIPEKLLKVVEEIDAHGQANLAASRTLEPLLQNRQSVVAASQV